LTAQQLRELAANVQAATGIDADIGLRLLVVKHGVTRYRITLSCYAGEYRSGRIKTAQGEIRWVRPSQFDEYPLSTTGRRLAQHVLKQG
jgi:A/G-specific adenine glycosylase